MLYVRRSQLLRVAQQCAVVAWVCGSFSSAASAQGLPADFSIVPILQGGLTNPITMSFPTAERLPTDKRLYLLVGEKTGRVVYQEFAGQSPVTVLQLDNNTIGGSTGEMGLLGMTYDPNFDIYNAAGKDNYVYVFVSERAPAGVTCDIQGNGCTSCFRANVSRYRFDLNPPLMHSPEIVWTGQWWPACVSQAYHWSGDIQFVGENDLFIASGDHFFPAEAQNPASELGKMLRITRANFGIGPAEVWSSGLRNPFRFGVDTEPPGGLYIGNVGSNGECNPVYEELNVASAATSGVNFGWPCQEGPASGCPCPVYSGLSVCQSTPCASFTPGWWSFDHTVGNAIIGGPVYRGSRYPPKYFGNAFVSEVYRGFIHRIPVSSTPADPEDFVPTGFVSSVVDLKIGPDESLYVLRYGTATSAGVYRIGYREPTVAISYIYLEQTGDPDDLTHVLFRSRVTYNTADFPNATFSYVWDFGDGTGSSAKAPFHVFPERTEYLVRLTVTIHSPGQPDWQVSAAAVEVATGLRPTVNVTAPSAGESYFANCPVAYAATGTDALGNPVTEFHWLVEWVHDEHTHLITDLPEGSSGVYLPPGAVLLGHEHPLPLRFVVDGVDSRGISSTAISPNVDPAEIEEHPAVLVNARAVEAPMTYSVNGGPAQSLQTPMTVNLGAGDLLSVTAPETVTSRGAVYHFRCWVDDAAAPRVRTGNPTGARNWTAHYALTPGTTCLVADSNADGCVDLGDLSVVLSTFGSSCCLNGATTLYNPDVDMTGDCKIDLSELSLVLGTYGNCE